MLLGFAVLPAATSRRGRERLPGKAPPGAGNRPGAARRHRGVTTLTSILISLTLFLSLGLSVLAAGTGAGRALQRRRGR